MLWLSCWTFLTQLDANVWYVCVTAAEVVMRSSFSLLGVVIERLATTLQELLSWVTWLRELAYQPWFPTRIRHQSRVPFDTHLFFDQSVRFWEKGCHLSCSSLDSVSMRTILHSNSALLTETSRQAERSVSWRVLYSYIRRSGMLLGIYSTVGLKVCDSF